MRSWLPLAWSLRGPVRCTSPRTPLTCGTRTPDWRRALSLKDAAANESDRADHGPRGAWDGWVGLSAVALGNLGDYEAAAELLRAAGTVLDEGPYGQAHRVYGDNNTKMVRPPRKGGDQAYLATCGVTLASAIVRSLFGFEPPVAGAVSYTHLTLPTKRIV